MTDYTARRTTMVDTQVRPSDVTKFPIIEAMLAVPREAFVPAELREAAYVGDNLDMGGGRVMLEPRTLAKMLDAIDVQSDSIVLDIGCGLGYSTAVVARIAEAVVAVEDDADRAAEAQNRLSEMGTDNAAVFEGPLTEGAAKHGPYDIILIQGAVEHLPATLTEQLQDGGRIAAIFMDGALGTVRIGHRSGSAIDWRPAFNAAAPVLSGFEIKRAFAF